MEKPTPCHSVLLMQTTIEYIRLSENTIRGCEQNVTCLTSHDRYQSWDSCHTVVSDYKVTFSPALHCLQSMMRFNHALYMAAYFSQNKASLKSRCTCQHICILHWPEVWIWWENEKRLVCSIIKNWDMRPPELYFHQTKNLMGVGTIGHLGF